MANYARKTMRLPLVGIVGLPERKDGRLFNAAAVVAGGEIVGIVHKRTLANYAEYYEKRQFDPAPAEEPPTVFEVGGLRFGVEICEDLWSPIPPSSRMAGVDVVFENVQARERTQILMDIANQEGALVVGTGDLSEIALGWNPYNGDHMSMYQINASVPKTMVLAALKGVASRCRYDDAVVERTCETFWRRFFAAQYKRNCVPDGPKITLSLSPRADWRMPSDAEAI